MSIAEVQELTKKYEKLQSDVDSVKKDINGVRHDVNGLRQTANINSEDLREIKYALVGNEDYNQEGLVAQLKAHTQKHVLLEKRVDDIEKVRDIEDKISKYKRNFFRVLFGSIGAAIVWILEKLIPYIFHL